MECFTKHLQQQTSIGAKLRFSKVKTPSFYQKTRVFKTPSFQKLYPFSKTPGFQNPVLSKTLPFFKNPRFSKPRPFKNSTLFQKPRFSKPRPFKNSTLFQKYPGFQNPVLSRTPSFFFQKTGVFTTKFLVFPLFFLDFEGYIKKVQSHFLRLSS